MPSYRIVWEIDIDADTPRAAAEEALAIQRDVSSIATVFTVYDGRIGYVIDVNEPPTPQTRSNRRP